MDTLNRLTDTTYFETGETESSVLDLVGNRQRHTDRAGVTHVYELDNPANEYATIDGASIAYDAAGNVTVDEDGRQYAYDEYNRLVEVRDSGNMVLASYEYDALGRRVVGDVGGSVTRYYYDGQSIVEERDGSDVRTRFHVHGAQFIDERVATYDDGSSEFTYALIDRNFSVVGTGDASGATIQRREYTPAGDFTYPMPQGFFFDDDADGDIDLDDYPGFADCMAGPGAAIAQACAVHDYQGDGDVDLAEFAVYQRTVTTDGVTPPYYANRATTYYHDFDFDRDVDQDDLDTFFTCLNAPVPGAACLAVHDFDPSGNSDGRITAVDGAGLSACLTSETVAPPAQCLRPQAGGSTRETGSFTLHGRPIDVLADGKILTYVRARFYDAKNGRWLQRDPMGNSDGANLYESFGSNPASSSDPLGTQSFNPATCGFFGATAEECRTMQDAAQLYAETLRWSGSEVYARTAAEAYLQPTVDLVTPEHQAVIGRLGRTGVIVVLNVVPYAFGVVPGLVVNAVTLSIAAPTSYYEREGQFLSLTGESLRPGEAVAIVVGDVSGASTVYLIGWGEDILTALPVDAATRVEAAGHLVIGFAAVEATPHAFPTIRTGTAIADQAAGRVFVRIEQGYNRFVAAAVNAKPGEVVLGTGTSPGQIPGRQLLFDFADPTPPQVVIHVSQAGEFTIIDWSGYPAGIPRPAGPFRILSGAEYVEARAAANAINAAIRRELPLWSKAGLEWHEIQPVAFGGSPTDLANKFPLLGPFHRQQVTPWWNRLQRNLAEGQ